MCWMLVDSKSWSEKDGCGPDLSGMIAVRYTESRFSPYSSSNTTRKAFHEQKIASESPSDKLCLGFLHF